MPLESHKRGIDYARYISETWGKRPIRKPKPVRFNYWSFVMGLVMGSESVKRQNEDLERILQEGKVYQRKCKVYARSHGLFEDNFCAMGTLFQSLFEEESYPMETRIQTLTEESSNAIKTLKEEWDSLKKGLQILEETVDAAQTRLQTRIEELYGCIS